MHPLAAAPRLLRQSERRRTELPDGRAAHKDGGALLPRQGERLGAILQDEGERPAGELGAPVAEAVEGGGGIAHDVGGGDKAAGRCAVRGGDAVERAQKDAGVEAGAQGIAFVVNGVGPAEQTGVGHEAVRGQQPAAAGEDAGPAQGGRKAGDVAGDEEQHRG